MNTEQITNSEQNSEKRLLSFFALKCGMFMSFYFALRFAAQTELFADLLRSMTKNMGENGKMIFSIYIQTLILYILPIAFTAFLYRNIPLFRKGGVKESYGKPNKFAKVIGNFPAMYGLGMAVNLITMLIVFLLMTIARMSDIGIFDFFDIQGQSDSGTPATVTAMICTFILYAIIAPVFEELWLRGIMWEAAEPFGIKFSIFSTAAIFGLMHGNVRQFFYASALGAALGYIRWITKSVLATTVLHAIFNSIAAILSVLLIGISDSFWEKKLIEAADRAFEEGVPAEEYTLKVDEMQSVFVSLSKMFMVFAIILMTVGIALFIKKIKLIKKLKITETSVLTENTKWKAFLLSPSMIALYLLITVCSAYFIYKDGLSFGF